jgi:glycosyltransferase involved in cell wall biosynthesis
VIVADAHSPDETAALARAAGAHVVLGAPGRGQQLNAGARAARGDILLFVHADVELPVSARESLRAATSSHGVIGGNFKLRFVPETPAARLYSAAYHLRRILMPIYYGDSCIFVRRSVFLELGGFADIPLFEDYEFVRRLERHGQTRYIRDTEVRASSRRFERRPLRTLALWIALQTAYSLRVSPERLARYYAAIR